MSQSCFRHQRSLGDPDWWSKSMDINLLLWLAYWSMTPDSCLHLRRSRPVNFEGWVQQHVNQTSIILHHALWVLEVPNVSQFYESPLAAADIELNTECSEETNIITFWWKCQACVAQSTPLRNDCGLLHYHRLQIHPRRGLGTQALMLGVHSWFLSGVKLNG